MTKHYQLTTLLDAWLTLRSHIALRIDSEYDINKATHTVLGAIDEKSYRSFVLYHKLANSTGAASEERIRHHDFGPFVPLETREALLAEVNQHLHKLWSHLTAGTAGRGALLLDDVKRRDLRDIARRYVRARKMAHNLRTKGFVQRPKKRSATSTPQFVFVVDRFQEALTVRFIGSLGERKPITIKHSAMPKMVFAVFTAMLKKTPPIDIKSNMNLDAEARAFCQRVRPVITYDDILEGSTRRLAHMRRNIDRLDTIVHPKKKTEALRQQVCRFHRFWDEKTQCSKTACLVPTTKTAHEARLAKTINDSRGWFINVLILFAPTSTASNR